MKSKTVFNCSECGYQASKWLGRCPECGEWNSLVEAAAPSKSSQKNIETTEAARLLEVKSSKSQRFVTGISEFDRVIGGGIVKDSVTIITSPPGGGKSTLTLTIAGVAANAGKRVLYATGEESDSQIKNRADRILDDIHENIWIIATTILDDVLTAIAQIDPDIIIVDSIQTFALREFLPARSGNPTQTMECAGELLACAKNKNRQRAVILIGQMNKNDEMAGLRSLEHLVDTVLVMEGEAQEELRSIIATKNRFGSTGEMGFFTMTEKGLISIDNPSEYFITRRESGAAVSGSALTVMREGSRPIIAEIESLVSRSFTPYPTRISEAMKKDQLNTLLSILEQRGGIGLYDKNVVIKTTGGIRLSEQSANLAAIISIASSVYEKPIPNGMAFIADVGLTGELKRVPATESRVKELDRMGFSKVVTARGGVRTSGNLKLDQIEILEFQTLLQVLQAVFGK